MPSDPDSLRAVQATLVRRARSRKEARDVIRRLEVVRRSLSRRSPAAAAACDLFMLLWAHRNAAFVSLATYERFFNRVEAHEPLGRVHRRFTLGKLPRIARLIQVFDRHPPGITDVMSESPQFRALAEIELLDELPAGITACGLRPRDRLIVHPGPEMYDGALAVLSLEAPARPGEFGKTILVVARILSSEPGRDRSECFRSFRILLRDFDRSAIVIPAGDARVECVIFNRPDVLSQLPVQ